LERYEREDSDLNMMSELCRYSMMRACL
jgi:hypothetical protein